MIKQSCIREETKYGKKTGKEINNLKEIYVNDNLKIIILNHLGEFAYPIRGKYNEKVDYYNVLLREKPMGIDGVRS